MLHTFTFSSLHISCDVPTFTIVLALTPNMRRLYPFVWQVDNIWTFFLPLYWLLLVCVALNHFNPSCHLRLSRKFLNFGYMAYSRKEPLRTLEPMMLDWMRLQQAQRLVKLVSAQIKLGFCWFRIALPLIIVDVNIFTSAGFGYGLWVYGRTKCESGTRVSK